MTIVYILVSSETDLYYEQALVSVYSLKQHNPNAYVVLLVDKNTAESLKGKRALIREYVSEVTIVDVPLSYSPKERSRYIKTTFRDLLQGELLYIDTDTVITGTLDNIAEFCNSSAEIACVLDYHSTLDNQVDGDAIKTSIRQLFGKDVHNENEYFNSGVILVKDTPNAARFFHRWHSYWEIAAFEKKQCFDQPAMKVADMESGNLITPLDGIFNCQILTSLRYLHQARIIHFFNNQWEGKQALSPFFGSSLYEEIKRTGEISIETADLIKNCKSAFYAPTYFNSPEREAFSNTIVSKTMYSLYKKKSLLFRFLTIFCKLRFRLILLIKNK